MGDETLTEKLVGMLGQYWQAVLDHAGVLSRRRAREIGAGEEPSVQLVAIVELLEVLDRSAWPTRWKQALFRVGEIGVDDLGFETFKAECEIAGPINDRGWAPSRWLRVTTSVNDHCKDMIERLQKGEESLEDALEWWEEWGRRYHVAERDLEEARLREQVTEKAISDTYDPDFETTVMSMENLLEVVKDRPEGSTTEHQA